MAFAFKPPAQPSLPIAGSDQLYPVRRIFCVGRNYAAHAAEMGNEVDRQAPFYFTKSAHHLCLAQGQVGIAAGTADYHHEIELVVALGSGGQNITLGQAPSHIFGYGVGLDMTRRDLQAAAKERARPWDIAKDVEQSAICGALTMVGGGFDPENGPIELRKNGHLTQQGDLSDQVYKPKEIIAHLSKFYRLEAGDLIFTGTPAGVAAVQAGDDITGQIGNLPPINLTFI